MSKEFKNERAWIHKKINSGVEQAKLLEGVGIFSNRKKKRVMEQKNLSEKQYEKRKTFLGNAYVLLSNEKFKPRAKEEKQVSKDNEVIPRTSRSAFRSREYTRGELRALVDNIDDIKF